MAITMYDGVEFDIYIDDELIFTAYSANTAKRIFELFAMGIYDYQFHPVFTVFARDPREKAARRISTVAQRVERETEWNK